MTEGRNEPISWASTVAECIGTDPTLVPGATAPIPLVAGAQSEGAREPAAAGSPARYEPLSVLGQGGMGRVLSARDAQFGRTVALKEMTLGHESPEFIRRFLLESIVTANLEHPGVVPVYERGVRDGAPFYVMRKVSGRALSAAIAEAKTLEQRLALVPAVIRAAHALGFAHERGVVHRDIKPDNIVLGAHGETVILDWGIAKVRGLMDEHGPDSPLANVAAAGEGTVAGAVLGTPSYMPPEQAQGKVDAIDSRTDVFALGAVLYEVLTGRPLYREATVMLTLSAAGMTRFEPIDRAAPDVPSGLREIVRKALSAEPAERFEDGSAMARALEAFQARAWMGEESVAARWFARAMAALGVVLTLLAAVVVWRALPSLRQLGLGAYFFVLAAVGALALGALEWRTRGRYKTLGIAAALTIACAFSGIANGTAGMVIVFRAIASESVLADERRWRAFFSEGLYESVGNIAGASTLAAVASVVLAIVHRRNTLLAQESRGG